MGVGRETSARTLEEMNSKACAKQRNSKDEDSVYMMATVESCCTWPIQSMTHRELKRHLVACPSSL